MSFVDIPQLTEQLNGLRQEHHELNVTIDRLSETPGCDQLQLTRMKKRKLQLKDAIARVESRLIPDLDA